MRKRGTPLAVTLLVIGLVLAGCGSYGSSGSGSSPGASASSGNGY